MTAFTNHFLFEFRTGLRNRTLLLMNYLLPLGFYVMVGLLMTAANPQFVNNMIAAMVVFAIMSATLLGMPEPLVTARENGIFRSYKINGVPASSILIIPALTTILHVAIVAIIIALSASALFDAVVPSDWLVFWLVFLGAVFAHAGIGMLIGVISQNSRVTVLWSQAFYLPSMILGGMMFPASLLPNSLRIVAMLLPSSYAMQSFQGLAYNGTTEIDPIWSLVILFADGLVAFGLAVFLFSWDSRNTTRRASPLLAILVLVPFALGAYFL